VGRSAALETCTSLGIDPDTKVRDLTDDEVVKIRQYIEANFRVEGDLRREVAQNIKRKVEIGSYQGNPPPPRPAGPGPAHPHQRPTRKGPRQAIAGKKKVTK
jgi:small subunit ribosomal protein S13